MRLLQRITGDPFESLSVILIDSKTWISTLLIASLAANGGIRCRCQRTHACVTYVSAAVPNNHSTQWKQQKCLYPVLIHISLGFLQTTDAFPAALTTDVVVMTSRELYTAAAPLARTPQLVTLSCRRRR